MVACLTLPTATIVIPARNAGRDLGGQLRALSNQSFGQGFEVIVSDNGSTDNTAAVADAWRLGFTSLRVVDAGARPGISYARNAGAAAAQGDVILFCDADDEVASEWVGAMTSALQTYDIVGGRLELAALNSSRTLSWRGDTSIDGLPTTMGYLPYAVGATIGVRSKVYRSLGGFNENYRGSHDEVEFCWRAQAAEHSLGYAHDAVVHYRLRSDLRSLWKQRTGYGRSYARLYKQYRHLGIERGRWRDEVEIWRELLSQLPDLAGSDSSGLWVHRASWNIGRLIGSVEHGLLCPQE